ncbi:MAG: hypothetical protein GX113_02055 [Actinobacteria bacterium]|nr:hypothetical protein [Actinomycetota bacterium]
MTSIARLAWMADWEESVRASSASRRSGTKGFGETRPTARTQVTARMDSSRYYGREATARVLQPSRDTVVAPRPLPRLRLVARRQQPRWGLIVMALAMIGALVAACIIAPMLIHSASTDLESTIGRLESEQKELAAANSALSAQISALSSPERVAEQATRLGLGPAVYVHYVEAEPGPPVAEGEPTISGR